MIVKCVTPGDDCDNCGKPSAVVQISPEEKNGYVRLCRACAEEVARLAKQRDREWS